jgi:hypothetical protein
VKTNIKEIEKKISLDLSDRKKAKSLRATERKVNKRKKSIDLAVIIVYAAPTSRTIKGEGKTVNNESLGQH